jgi:two-component system nitrogen regulation response regulator GlnG
MSLGMQTKLLRVLEDNVVRPVGSTQSLVVDVRIIAATHRDLDECVREGTFREDLLYRLRVVPMSIPPLRARMEDVRTLALHFVERYATELTEGPVSLPERTIARLESHDWPGNVRELENAIKRALVLSTNDVLSPEEFDFLTSRVASAPVEATLEELVVREVERLFDSGEDVEDVYHQIQRRVERPLLEVVLERTQGNQIRAAAMLGINRNTLRKKITELDIELPHRS